MKLCKPDASFEEELGKVTGLRGFLSQGAKTSASNANICGLNEMGVMSKIRISEEDLSAEDWEAVLFSFLPEPENRRDQEKDIESPKNEGAV